MKYANLAITVSELNKYIKDKISEDEALSNILVKGEISNFKNHYTGHMYFTLKDENSLIKCIMFKSYAEKLTFMPKDGMKVMVFGGVSVFERDRSVPNICKSYGGRWPWRFVHKISRTKKQIRKRRFICRSA